MPETFDDKVNEIIARLSRRCAPDDAQLVAQLARNAAEPFRAEYERYANRPQDGYAALALADIVSDVEHGAETEVWPLLRRR